MHGFFDVFDHRSHDLDHAAQSHGLEHAESDTFGCARAPFPLLRRGSRQTVSDVVWRNNDPHAVRVFDFRYFTDVGNDTNSSPIYTCVTALANAAWPYLTIKPAPGNLAVTNPFTEEERFDSLDMAFNEAFTVHCSDDHFATALLDVEMRNFLLGKASALDMEVNGAWLFLEAEHIPADIVPDLFAFVDDLIAHVPRVVGELYPPPLKGDINTAMPDPGRLAPVPQDHLDQTLQSLGFANHSSATQLVSTVLGYSNRAPAFQSSTLGESFVEAAIDQEIMDDPAWNSAPLNPLDALGTQDADDQVAFDLDGNPIAEERQDPWGPGRPMPDDTNDS